VGQSRTSAVDDQNAETLLRLLAFCAETKQGLIRVFQRPDFSSKNRASRQRAAEL
jgi:hypothetical protein